MSNISDIIEQFILKQLEDDSMLDLSRNELASFFNCAPSQINYVLSTRFTNPRGFLVESRRGGGGYIRLIRLNADKNEYIHSLIGDTLSDGVDFTTACQILDNLLRQGYITESEYGIILSCISNSSLNNPLKLENKLRANILRNVLINIIKEDNNV